MAQIKIKARVRKATGKGPAKRMRAGGKIPGIVYGKGIETLQIEMDAKEIHALTHGPHAGSLESVLVSLEIEDGGEEKARPALITEIQHDPIKRDVLHIDFHQVSLTEKIHARIRVVTVGECPGTGAGGIVEHTLRELDVACLPTDLPEDIRVDVSKLELGHCIHVRDIDLGPKVHILNDADLSIVSVTTPRVVAAAAEKVEEEVVEPEVITEKKEKEEGEEEAPEKEKGA